MSTVDAFETDPSVADDNRRPLFERYHRHGYQPVVTGILLRVRSLKRNLIQYDVRSLSETAGRVARRRVVQPVFHGGPATVGWRGSQGVGTVGGPVDELRQRQVR